MPYYFARTLESPFEEAVASMQAIDHPDLKDVAGQVAARLKSMVEAP